MGLIGIERLVYSVDDIEQSTRYFLDFGLVIEHREADATTFLLPEGSRVLLLKSGHPRLPPSSIEGNGVHEVVWGVDDASAFEQSVADLRTDREVWIDAEGVAHFAADGGVAMGLKVFVRRPVVYAPDPINAPFNAARVNQTRKWRRGCMPKTINHVVFGLKDHLLTFEFLRQRLGFRLSDVMRGCGVFGRCDGANDHHQIFLIEADATIEGLDGRNRFHHADFGVEDLDELMIGVNTMERRGWPKSTVGLGRHRLSSGLFCYLPCPAGGQAEYGTDFDSLDDNWIPRIYEVKFSYSTWLAKLPPFLMEEPEWDWEFHPDYRPGPKPGMGVKLEQPYPEQVA